MAALRSIKLKIRLLYRRGMAREYYNSPSYDKDMAIYS